MDYDRRAAQLKPETAIDYDSGRVLLSVLSGALLGVWYRADSEDAEVRELEKRIQGLTAGDERELLDEVGDLVEKAGWRYGKLGDRNPGLSKLQRERVEAREKVQAKAFSVWLREWVIRFAKGQYEAYRSGRLREEPCITAGYCRGWLLDGGELPREWWPVYRGMNTRKQLSLCQYALEAGRKGGQLGTSLGAGAGGRETRCYEPA